MLSFLSPQHPLEKTYTKSRDLVDAVKSLSRCSHQYRRSSFASQKFQQLTARNQDLQRWVRTEIEWWSVCDTTSRDGIWKIRFVFGRFRTALKELDQELATTYGQPAKQLTDDVHRAVIALTKAIVRLAKAVDSSSVKVVEAHGRDLEGFIKVRDAMFTLDKKDAEELTGPEVDSWANWPGIDTEIPHQVLRLAKLIRLSKVPDQVFGLSVQSNAPGRPLKHMTRLTKFPTEEDLRILGRKMGGPVKVYVVASKPRWRKAWTFKPNEVSWWD